MVDLLSDVVNGFYCFYELVRCDEKLRLVFLLTRSYSHFLNLPFYNGHDPYSGLVFFGDLLFIFGPVDWLKLFDI